MQYLNHIITNYPLLSVLLSFIIGLCFMPLIIDIAKKRNFVVKPNKRTSHEGTIPNIGGINIFILPVSFWRIFLRSSFPDLHFQQPAEFIPTP